jgi:flagellar hook-length control protein FliK
MPQPADFSAMIGTQVSRDSAIDRDVESSRAWRPNVERLADDIVSHARLGRKEAVLQLDPPELGKIKIDLRVEDGKLHAQIIAEGPDSKKLLEAHLPELRQALAAGRLDVADVCVTQGNWSGPSGDFSRSFHHSPRGQQESGGNFSHASPAVDGEQPTPAHNQTSARQAGRVSMWA